MLDFGVILLLLPALVVLGTFLALLIKISSPGPVFFRQKRVGFRGSKFICYKFRTMRPDAAADTHREHARDLIQSQAPMTKLDAQRDPRLIPFAGIIRATGLDELPQLFNVLRGEMSIVGPRPCIPYEYELYSAWQRQRLDAVPGLTGWWQVCGKNRTTFEEMVKLDIEYAQRMSLWFDLWILARTAPALVGQCVETKILQRKQTPVRTGLAKSVPFYHL